MRYHVDRLVSEICIKFIKKKETNLHQSLKSPYEIKEGETVMRSYCYSVLIVSRDIFSVVCVFSDAARTILFFERSHKHNFVFKVLCFDIVDSFYLDLSCCDCNSSPQNCSNIMEF